MLATPTCPAALALAGPLSGPSVICGALAIDRDEEGTVAEKGTVGNVVFTSGSDPAVYHGACHGRYTGCLIWRAEKERIWEQRRSLESEEEEERRKFVRDQRSLQREMGVTPLKEG